MFVNLVGKHFGRWIVVRRVPNVNGRRSARWLCHCECGCEKEVDSSILNRGKSRSCGCLNRESAIANCLSRTIHGHNRRGRTSLTLATLTGIIQSAIEKGYDQGYEDCRKLWKADTRSDDTKRPPPCALCGRKPHPDSWGHSYRRRDENAIAPAERGEQPQGK